MTAITDVQTKWLTEFCGIDLAVGGCSPDAEQQRSSPVLTGPAPRDGIAPIDPGAPLAGMPPALQSFTTPAPQPGSGGSSHDDSDIEFTTSYSLFWTGPDPSATIVRTAESFDKRTTTGIRVPGQGRLTLNLTIEGFQDNQWPHGNGKFTQDATVIWQISADAEGKLTIQRDSVDIGQHDGGTDYRLDSLNPDEKASFVSVNPVIVGTSDSESDDSGWNVNVNVGGKKIGGGGGISGGSSTSRTKAAPKIQTSIVINLNPVLPKKPPPPEPHGTVTIGPEVSGLGKFDFEIGPFKVGKTELESGSVTKRVYDIFSSLPEAAQTSLNQGKQAGDEWPDGSKTGKGELIEIHGYTSNTDSEDHNFELSKKRAEAVLAAFKSLGVPPSAFAPVRPHGEWETLDDTGVHPTDKKSEEKESAAWRKVVLKMMVAQTFVVK